MTWLRYDFRHVDDFDVLCKGWIAWLEIFEGALDASTVFQDDKDLFDEALAGVSALTDSLQNGI